MTALRQTRFRGTYKSLGRVGDPQRGDVATLAWPERGTWIYDGVSWRRMKMTDEPEPENPRTMALRRLRTPLKKTIFCGKGHSETTLAKIPDPERGHYAVGPGNTEWIYDGIEWRRMLKKEGKR